MAWEEPRKTGMVYRRLGRSGLHVSAIALGGWLTYGGHVEDEKTFECMKQAYDLGVNFFDTAEKCVARFPNPDWKHDIPSNRVWQLHCRQVGDRHGQGDQEVRMEAQRLGHQHQGKSLVSLLSDE
jgi:hypothetical protein